MSIRAKINRVALAAAVAAALVACGDKTPESEASKKLGEMPKQTLDSVRTKLDAAAQKGEQRNQEEDGKAQ